jgi:hypothetical protein
VSIEAMAAMVGAFVLDYANQMGLPRSIGEYVAAKCALLFIWSQIFPT